jgi:5-hydroxyisourate hydrolase-like protein (transthyretin family)
LFPTIASQTATIEFTLPDAMPIRIELFNVNGQKVQNIVYQVFEQGNHDYQFDLNEFNLENGVYFVKFSAGKYATTSKMIYQK